MTCFFHDQGYTEAILLTEVTGVKFLNLTVALTCLVELLLLMGAARLCGCFVRFGRAALASLLGGLHALACLTSGFGFLANGWWRAVALVVMALIAYGMDRSSLRAGALYGVLSLAMGGLAELWGRSDSVSVAVSVLVLGVLCILAFWGRMRPNRFVPVSIIHGRKRVDLTALVDTGNTLHDPVSGREVLVADQKVGETLLGLSADQLAAPAETLMCCGIPGLRLIPYTAVGQRGGMLLGLRVDRLVMNGKEQDLVVAFAPQMLGQGGGYRALAGGTV